MSAGPDLGGKTAIVTGASGTLGQAIAALYVRCGGTVVLADRGGPALDRALAATGAGDRAMALAVDTDAPEYAKATVAAALERFGRLDALITAAGLLQRGAFTEMTAKQTALMTLVNFDYVEAMSRAAIPALAEGGALLHLASLSAHTGRAESAHYAATKGAVVALTKSLAAEYAPRLRANCLSPGFVRSPLADQVVGAGEEAWLATIPMGRFGTPDEIARAAIFLVSDWAAYITGQVLHVNGGQYSPG